MMVHCLVPVSRDFATYSIMLAFLEDFKELFHKKEIQAITCTCNNCIILCLLLMPVGRKIAPNTGANATKFFTLATKSSELIAKLAT